MTLKIITSSLLVLGGLFATSILVMNLMQAGPEISAPSFFAASGTDRDIASDSAFEKRREELKKIYEERVYGAMPSLRPVEGSLYDQGTLKSGHKWERHKINIEGLKQPILATVFLPKTTTAAPALMFLNKCGAQTVVADKDFPEQKTQWFHPYCLEQKPMRGFRTGFWSVEAALDKGYALIAVFENEIAEDSAERFAMLKESFPEDLKAQSKETGILMFWAWGLRHVHQYISTLPSIDEKRFGAIGHSRRGKASLLLAAFHKPLSFVVAHQSGTGGAAMFRSNRMETIEKITTQFPHWFSPRLAEFSGRENDLPVDQHLLISLAAPRPVLITEGLWDLWANWKLSWRSLKEADQVYRRLGVRGLASDSRYTFYDRNNAHISGRLAQVLEVSDHNMSGKYWTPIIDFLNNQWNSN